MLRKEHFGIAKLASNDSGRYATGSIQVTPKSVRVTDGKLLLLAEHAEYDTENCPKIEGVTATNDFAPFLLAKKDALDIGKQMPKISKKFDVPALYIAQVGSESNENGTAVIGATDLENARVWRPKKVDAQFPKLDLVIPELSCAKAVVTVDPHLLAHLLTQMGEFQNMNNPPAVTIRIESDSDVIRLDAMTSDGEALVACLMPITPDSAVSNDDYPAKLRAEREPA